MILLKSVFVLVVVVVVAVKWKRRKVGGGEEARKEKLGSFCCTGKPRLLIGWRDSAGFLNLLG